MERPAARRTPARRSEAAPPPRAPEPTGSAEPSAPNLPAPLSWFATAARRDVVARSLRVSLVVGTLLVVINYADRALAGQLNAFDYVKMGLTYLVPYGVATYAAVQAIRRG